MIKVIYRGQYKQYLRCDTEYYEANNIKELLRHIKHKHGNKIYKFLKQGHIALNDKSINLLSRYATKLQDGDTVIIMPICCGG